MGLLWRRPPNVARFKRREDVDSLVRALRYEDPITDRDGRYVDLGADVRAAAAEALAEMEGSEARDGLMRALEDPEESVRAATIRALREHGQVAGIEPLIRAVTHWTEPERAELREEALEALAWLKHPDVPRQAAVQLLTRPQELDPADEKALRRLAEASGPEAARATVDDLVRNVRRGLAADRAATLLGVLADHSAEPLIELLDEPAAQEQAALTLGSMHDSRAVPRLSTLLEEADDPATRRAAAWALGEIRDLAAAEVLLRASGDADYEVRAAAITGFDNLGNAAIAITLTGLVSTMIENGRAAVAEVQAQSGEPAAALPAGAESPAQRRPPVSGRPRLRRLLGRYRRN